MSLFCIQKSLFRSFTLAQRCLSTAPVLQSKGGDDAGSSSWLKSMFVRRLEPVKESQSHLLSNQNHVYELQMHKVKPECMFDYLKDFKLFTDSIHDHKTGAKLVASFTSTIGEQDVAYHLWQYVGGFKTLNQHYKNYRTNPDFGELRQRRNTMLVWRKTQICHPFSFWPAIQQKEDSPKNIFEMRSYTLKPGTTIEWGNYWARALQARSMGGEAVVGLFTNIGDMHVVHHVWAYRDLQHRKESRDAAWRHPGWDECVQHTVPLIRHMTSTILEATPFSPIQ